MDDWDLLRAYARDRAQEPFARLAAKYSDLVFATALRRTRRRDLAEDVTQAVFIVLARRAGELRPTGSLAGWLHRTALFASSEALRAEHRRLRLQQVLAGLHQDGVDAALEHAGDLLPVGVPQRDVRRMSQRRQLRPRTDRPEHEPGLRRGAELVRLRAGQFGTRLGELEDPVRDVVLGQIGQIRPERVRLDRVDADLEIGAVHGAHDVRTGHVQDLVAALETGEIIQRRVLGLQHRAHRTVRDDDALCERGQQGVRRRIGHYYRVIRSRR